MAKFLGRTKQKVKEAMGKTSPSQDPDFEVERIKFDRFREEVDELKTSIDQFYAPIISQGKHSVQLISAITKVYMGAAAESEGTRAIKLVDRHHKAREENHAKYTELEGKLCVLITHMKELHHRVNVRDKTRLDKDRKEPNSEKHKAEGRHATRAEAAKMTFVHTNTDVLHELHAFNQSRFERMDDIMRLFVEGERGMLSCAADLDKDDDTEVESKILDQAPAEAISSKHKEQGSGGAEAEDSESSYSSYSSSDGEDSVDDDKAEVQAKEEASSPAPKKKAHKKHRKKHHKKHRHHHRSKKSSKSSESSGHCCNCGGQKQEQASASKEGSSAKPTTAVVTVAPAGDGKKQEGGATTAVVTVAPVDG